MATRIISISKQPTNKELYLTDNEGNSGSTITTKAKPGDTVIWQLEPGGGIEQITGIIEKPVSGSVNVFSSMPTPVDPKDPKSPWQATIGKDVTGSEIYDIAYMVDGEAHIGDPVIEVDDDDNE